jgi:hypothetical protein
VRRDLAIFADECAANAINYLLSPIDVRLCFFHRASLAVLWLGWPCLTKKFNRHNHAHRSRLKILY